MILKMSNFRRITDRKEPVPLLSNVYPWSHWTRWLLMNGSRIKLKYGKSRRGYLCNILPWVLLESLMTNGTKRKLPADGCRVHGSAIRARPRIFPNFPLPPGNLMKLFLRLRRERYFSRLLIQKNVGHSIIFKITHSTMRFNENSDICIYNNQIHVNQITTKNIHNT